MTEFRGGAGGYGGITTLNQEGRKGRYEPHLTISRTLDRVLDRYMVKCLRCGEEWEHGVGLGERWAPEECVAPEVESYDEDLAPKLYIEVEDD